MDCDLSHFVPAEVKTGTKCMLEAGERKVNQWFRVRIPLED